MNTIKNSKALSDEIKKMQLVIDDKESRLRTDVHELYQSLLPSMMLATAFNRIRSDIKENWWNSTTWKAVQGGLLIWAGHLFFKVKTKLEKHLLGLIDRPFNNLKALTGNKTR